MVRSGATIRGGMLAHKSVHTYMAKRQTDEASIRVLVADKTPMESRLLGEALRHGGQFRVVATVEASETLDAVRGNSPDVVIAPAVLDENAEFGAKLVMQLRSSECKPKCILLLDRSERQSIVDAFRSGAHGVFRRSEPIKALRKCITAVHADQIWIDNQQLHFVLDAFSSLPASPAMDPGQLPMLSQRERDVVRCLSEGLTNNQIAGALRISHHTVKNYLFRIFEKLGVSSRVELLLYLLSQKQAADHLEDQGLKSRALLQFEDRAGEKAIPKRSRTKRTRAVI